MSFFISLYQSLYNFPWLRSQRREKSKAWMYAILFFLVASILHSGVMLWTIPRGIEKAELALDRSIPDFRATFTNGILTVDGPAQPYVYKSEPLSESGERFVVVVDTVATTTINVTDFVTSPQDTAIVVTRTGMIAYEGGRAQTRSQEWRDIPNTTFTRADVMGFVRKFSGMIGYFIAPILILFMFIFWSIGKLVYLALIALLVWVISLFAKREWKYGEVFAVGLFALTAPTILQILLFWSGVRLPWVYTILLLVYMLGAIFFRSEKALPPTTPVPPMQG